MEPLGPLHEASASNNSRAANNVLTGSSSLFYKSSNAAQWLALPAWGGRVDSPSKRESAEAKKKLKNAARTPSRVHALLGGNILFCSLFYSKVIGSIPSNQVLCDPSPNDSVQPIMIISLFGLCFIILNQSS